MLQSRKRKEGERCFNQCLLYFLSSIFACKANPLPSPVTRVTITPTLTVKCARPRILAPTSWASGPSPIISLPLLLHTGSSDSQTVSSLLSRPITPSRFCRHPRPTLTHRVCFPRPLPPRRQMCNLLLACIITSGGRNLPSSWGTTQHTRPTQEKKTPPPRGGGL